MVSKNTLQGGSLLNKRKHVLFLLTVPAMLMVLLFIAVPLVNAVRISFFKWNGYSQSMKWIGLNNYTKIFSDRWFGISFWNTMLYGFGSTLLQNILGLLSALYVNKNFRGRNAMRVIMYMPIMISAFLMGKIMYYFFQYDGGVFNEMLSLLQLNPVYWTESGTSSAIIITLVNSWQYMGLCMLIYLSGLQGVPMAYREAARLDGANAWQEFIHVVFPLLIPAITTAVVTNLIGGFKMYDVIVSLTGGGPANKSMSLSFYITKLYFTDEKAGYSSAVGVGLFFIIMVITWPINQLLHKKEVQF